MNRATVGLVVNPSNTLCLPEDAQMDVRYLSVHYLLLDDIWSWLNLNSGFLVSVVVAELGV